MSPPVGTTILYFIGKIINIQREVVSRLLHICYTVAASAKNMLLTRRVKQRLTTAWMEVHPRLDCNEVCNKYVKYVILYFSNENMSAEANRFPKKKNC